MSEPTRILAIRHGETAWNVDTRIQGQLDIPLNETGRWQAERVGEALAHEGIDAIYASDLKRALVTAQAISRACGVPVRTDTGLRERAFGSFEGQTFAEIETRWPEDAVRWRRRDVDFRPGGGESLRMFYERCEATATRLASAHPGQTVVLVAHGGVMDCLYRAATRVELSVQRSWLLGNASINRLLYSPQGFSLVGWSDNEHLQHESRDETGDRAGHAA
jgi:probable phosphoglycerate mutase